jgi:hypothetical protein
MDVNECGMDHLVAQSAALKASPESPVTDLAIMGKAIIACDMRVTFTDPHDGLERSTGGEFSFHPATRILEAACDDSHSIIRRWQLRGCVDGFDKQKVSARRRFDRILPLPYTCWHYRSSNKTTRGSSSFFTSRRAQIPTLDAHTGGARGAGLRITVGHGCSLCPMVVLYGRLFPPQSEMGRVGTHAFQHIRRLRNLHHDLAMVWPRPLRHRYHRQGRSLHSARRQLPSQHGRKF